MAKAYGQCNPEMAAYADRVFRPEDEILSTIRGRSLELGLPEIQVGAFDGLHLEILMRLLNARLVVEIGSLGGYSATCLLRGMAPGGRLFAFELAEARARLVERHTAEAGFPGQVQAFSGPALQSLVQIESLGPFDAVFIDANKSEYPQYLAWAAEHLRLGGAAIGDNTFGKERVHLAAAMAEGRLNGVTSSDAAKAIAMDRFNRDAAQGGRFRATILPTAEGLTVAVKVR